MTFGQSLKMLRRQKGFTQKELAAAIEVKHNSISNWENDQNVPGHEIVKKICLLFDIDRGSLFGDEPKPEVSPIGQSITQDEARFLTALRYLDEGGRAEVLEYIQFKLARSEASAP